MKVQPDSVGKTVWCYSHFDYHTIKKNTSVICYECGHPFSERQLRNADYRQNMHMLKFYPAPTALRLFLKAHWYWLTRKEVVICPECTHNL